MSEQFLYILAGIVFVAIYIILWFHGRWCKAKGIKPKPAFSRLKKHGKRIAKWSDIFIVAIILLQIFFCGYFFAPYLIRSFFETGPDREMSMSFSFSAGFMMFFSCSVWSVFMASLLSPFQKNITSKKRIILLAMCCIPLVFWLPLYLFDNTFENNHIYLKLLIAGLFTVLLINWPAIFLGKSFIELIMPLCNRARRWLGLPEWEETDSE